MRFFLKPILVLFGMMTLLSSAAVGLGGRDLPHPLQNFWFTVYDRGFNPQTQSESPEVRLYHAATGGSWQLLGTEDGVRRNGMAWSLNQEWLIYETDEDEPLRRVHWTGKHAESLSKRPIYGAWHMWQASPDRQQVAWMEPNEANMGVSALYIADSNGQNIRLLNDNIPYSMTPTKVYWSLNGEWIFVIGNMTYTEGRDFSDPLEIFRIRPDGTDFEKLTSIEDEWLRQVAISGQYIGFTSTISGSDTLFFYVFNLGENVLQRLTERTDVNSNANLWIEADSLLYNDPFADHRNYLEIDIQSGQVQLVFESSEIRDFRMADYVRWASHDRVFDIVGRFEDGVQVRLVSDSEGHQLAVIPNYQCNRSTNFEDFESIWLDGQLYFFDQLPSGNCRLMQLSRDYTETMVLQTFPSGAQYFGFLESENEWWVVYDIERTEYLVNFDGSLTYLLIELDEDSYISTWVENELPQGDYRVALGIGVVCIGSGWILRRRRL